MERNLPPRSLQLVRGFPRLPCLVARMHILIIPPSHPDIPTIFPASSTFYHHVYCLLIIFGLILEWKIGNMLGISFEISLEYQYLLEYSMVFMVYSWYFTSFPMEYQYLFPWYSWSPDRIRAGGIYRQQHRCRSRQGSCRGCWDEYNGDHFLNLAFK